MQRTLSNSIPFSAPNQLKMQRLKKQRNRVYKVYPCKNCGVDMNAIYKNVGVRSYCSRKCKLEAIEKRKSYQCKSCGVNMFRKCTDASRRSYCSKECWLRKSTKVEKNYCCDVCGVSFFRIEYKTTRIRRGIVCSKACQNKLRNKLGHQDRRQKVDWEERSLAARKKMQKQSRDARFKKWCGGMQPFFRAVDVFIERERYRPNKTTWLTKISQRLVRRPQSTRRKTGDRNPGINGAIYRLNAKVKYQQQDPWQKKIGNKLSNASKRLRLKREKRQAQIGNCVKEKARAKPVQMCFDWMASDC
jgi:hypothetical protein